MMIVKPMVLTTSDRALLPSLITSMQSPSNTSFDVFGCFLYSFDMVSVRSAL
ncbi:hypothetical protein DFR27_2090 [Umboniibacter marinipuniceus]|uniref:Uncharacterized protein n=1 Tax=Umboniibacter marinipuniceus TaxID=569599 RepID=A0A3M0AHQ6_9GAMM|nr:hypothetical protein DFR27_2090 [Umboniibacter marinipuniceus]